MTPYVLVVLTGKHKGKRVRLVDAETVIGRDEDAKIRLATNEISRQHCLLIVTEAGLLVRDLGSRNGTFINGVPIAEETILNPGDTITAGPMTFELDGGEALKKKPAAINPKGKGKPKALDDEIAGWLTDEAEGALSTSDTTILSNKPKPAPPPSPVAPKPLVREFKSVAEEAEDIIRRHLESLKTEG